MADDIVTAVDPQRVQAALTSLEVRCSTFEDGAVRASFRASVAGVPSLGVTVHVDGTSLMVRGGRDVAYAADDAPRALVQVDRWHRECRWPKGHLGWHDGEQLFAVVGEVHHPVADGVTDAQLLGVLRIALGSLDDFTAVVHQALVGPRPRPAAVAPGDVDLESWLED